MQAEMLREAALVAANCRPHPKWHRAVTVIIPKVATYYIESFGCRATQADSAAIERDLLAHGLARSAGAESASVAVLNTCTVTAAADQDARSAIRRIHRENPGCSIVVTGCYAQR